VKYFSGKDQVKGEELDQMQKPKSGD